MGVPIATYTQHEKADRHLPARRAAQYARFFKTTPEYLLYARADAVPDRVPVLSKQGLKTGHSVAYPPKPTELTVAQAAIEGDGISHFGFVPLYDEPQTRAVDPDLDGRLCVVSLEVNGAEHRLTRVLKKGSTVETFHLLSVAGGLAMIDQKLTWAAPVIALVPATV